MILLGKTNHSSDWHAATVLTYWSALATAPAETSAEAKEASIINNS